MSVFMKMLSQLNHRLFHKIRFILPLLFSFFFLNQSLYAQDAATDNSSQTSQAQPQGNQALSKSEAKKLLNILDNPKKREEFTQTLSLIAKGLPSDQASANSTASDSTDSDSSASNAASNSQDATAPKAAAVAAKPASKAAAPATTDSSSTENSSEPAALIDKDVSDDLNIVSRYIVKYTTSFAAIFKDMGFVSRWFHYEMTHQAARTILFKAVLYGLLIFGIGLALEYTIVFFTRGLLRTIKERAQSYETAWSLKHAPQPENNDDSSDNLEIASDVGDAGSDNSEEKAAETKETRAEDHRRQNEVMAFIIRIPFAFYHLITKLLPVAIFLGFNYIVSALISPSRQAEALTLSLANAYALSRTAYIILESTFAPKSPPIRLLPASDSTAALVIKWANILVITPSIGMFLISMGDEFHIARRGIEALILASILVEHLFLAAFIWRIRHIVAQALRPPEKLQSRPFWRFISTIIGLWWIPAIFVDIALWVVWATRFHGGYRWMLRSCILTVAILVFSRLAAVLAYGAQENLFNFNDDMKSRYPRLQKRADFYYPYVRSIITFVITAVSLIALTQSWGIPTLRFLFKSSIGARLTSLAFSLFIAITVAVTLWEVINAMLNRQIDRYHESNQFSRATRLRTVFPIIRTVLLVFIIAIVAVTTLSQIGINVAPLLTGAGIMGAAIAFGSQSLVKDFITGFFMLVEDAIQVGDWVSTGGVSGTVEHLSIRTLRVRAVNGDLHIIPFSSVSSIANTGRDFNQIIIRQTLDLSEDPDRLVKIMQKTIDEMRKEDAYKDIIYSGYNDLGVDISDSNGSVLVGSIRTAAMMKWKVQREFYRRLGNRMAEANIKFYTGTSYYTTPPGSPLHWINDQPSPAPQSDTDMMRKLEAANTHSDDAVKTGQKKDGSSSGKSAGKEADTESHAAKDGRGKSSGAESDQKDSGEEN
ncbi:mechanosensitive ion channel family protein [Zymomonas mobilis]|uniref:mechanosensitive ion channel family protein n=1 Tax=Zymomonas mobilis TaxID=542 RepID=UPI0039EA67EB